MYGLNAFALILFSALNVIAVHLCQCSAAVRTRTLHALCAALLLFNVLRYAVPPLLGAPLRVPVEFSTVAYFTVPMILLTGQRQSQSWAAYAGLMAGFFYYLCLIALGGPIYGSWNPAEIHISMACHGTLYFCGLVTIGTQQFDEADSWKLLGGVALIAVRAQLLRPFAGDTSSFFIYQLMDGALLQKLLPAGALPAVMPAYYALLALLVLLSVRGFFRQNRTQYRKGIRTGAAS